MDTIDRMRTRSAAAGDTDAVVALAVSSGLFPAGDAGVVTTLMTDYFAGADRRDHRCLLLLTDADTAIGVAYYQAAVATDRTWYLTMIAIASDHQGHGHGTTLLRQVEADMTSSRQRLLLVETSGRPEFAATRRFYDKCGYAKVATVADYYQAGDDLVLYRHELTRT